MGMMILVLVAISLIVTLIGVGGCIYELIDIWRLKKKIKKYEKEGF